MKNKMIAGFLLAAGSVFAAPRIAVGIGVGAPVAPAYVAPAYDRAYADPACVPPSPGPDYVFLDGYWQYRPRVIHRDFDRHETDRRDFHRR